MQLQNSFTVPVPIDEAWRVLTDVERIAPCMPGAALDSVDGDDFTGRVKVKLGPINLTYAGKASFVEKDESAHRAVIDARGKDQRGNGTAAAVVTATLAAEGTTTRVDVVTELNITGRPAQFGRGVMTDVGNKLLGQFADKLGAQLAGGDAGATAPAATPSAGARAAATVSGAVEEVAASLEQAPGDNGVARTARTAGTAAKKTAAAVTDAVAPDTADSAAPATKPPAKKSPAAKTSAAKSPAAKAPAAKAAPAKTPSTRTPSTRTPPAKTPSTRTPPTSAAAATTPAAAAAPTSARGPAVKARPSAPPTARTAPPTRPATGAPARSGPVTPRPTPAEPAPIDLLEVAGASVLTRYAAPLAGAAVVVVIIAVLHRRRRR